MSPCGLEGHGQSQIKEGQKRKEECVSERMALDEPHVWHV